MDLLNDYLNSGAFTEKENIEVNESDLKNANIDVSSPIQKPIKETIIKEYSGNNIPVVPANPTPATPSYNFGSSMPEFSSVGSASTYGEIFGTNTNFDANGKAIGPMAKAAEIAGVKNLNANTPITGNENIMAAIKTPEFRRNVGKDEFKPMLFRVEEVVGHRNFAEASLENYEAARESFVPKPKETKTTPISDILGPKYKKADALELANAMGAETTSKMTKDELGAIGIAIGPGDKYSNNNKKLAQYFHDKGIDPNNVIPNLPDKGWDRGKLTSQIQTHMEAIGKAPDRADIDALQGAFNKGHAEIKSANETMAGLGAKMQNQGVLTGDEMTKYKEAKETLGVYKELVDSAKAEGIDVGKQLNGIEGYSQYSSAIGTGYDNYEISGGAGKEFFKKVDKGTAKIPVADSLAKLNELGPVANADLGGGYAEYLQKNDVKFGVEKLDNLVELAKKGVDLDDEAKSIVEAAAKVNASGMGSDSSANSSLYAAVDSYSGDYAKVTKNQLSLFGDGADGSMTGTMADGKITVGQNHRDTLKGLLNEDELKDKTISKFMETGEVTSDLDLKGLNSKLIDNKKTIDETAAFNKNIDDVFNNIKDDQLDNILKNNGVDIGTKAVEDVVPQSHKANSPLKKINEGYIEAAKKDKRTIDYLEESLKELDGKIEKDPENVNLQNFKKNAEDQLSKTKEALGQKSDTINTHNQLVSPDPELRSDIRKTLSSEGAEKVIEKATGSTAGMTRDEKIEAAKKIVGMGGETDSGYSYGKGFTAKILNDEDAMNAAVDAFNDGSDTSIINAMFNVGDDKGAFRNAEQFAKKYKADPKAAMKELNERIGFAAEGNLNEKLTSKNLKEALKDVNINNHVGDGGKAILDAAEDKGGKFLNQGAKKLKNLAGKAEGDIDVKGFAEAGKEAVEAASETIKKFGGEGKEAKGVLAKAGKAISGHAGKTALMIGAGLAIGGISSAVSSAQEERQRKERELSQLMMAQSSNARGLY